MPTEEKLLDGLPGPAAQGMFSPDDPRILGWLKEAREEGERINSSDPSFDGIDKNQEFVLGEQQRGGLPSYIPDLVFNRVKKAIRTHKSALTDIRPLFSYKSRSPKNKRALDLLNDLIVVWWTNSFADVALSDAIAYATTAGCGDVIVEYDPNFLEGDNHLVPRDCRDTLPIRPSRDRSIQTWEGLILREAHSVNALRGMYPEYRDRLKPSSGGKVYTKFRTNPGSGGPTSTLDGLKSPSKSSFTGLSDIILDRCYINDRSINENTHPILVGKPGTNWSYVVEPMQPLYPRKRLILATENCILYDGPNPDWHGMYPVSRLKLDPWPWVFLGLGITHDLRPIQRAINDTFNNFLLNFQQHAQPGALFDANAAPQSVVDRFDQRKPNFKLRLKAGMGDAYKANQAPELPAWAMSFLQALLGQFDDLAETANLAQMMQLRQMPGADTIEKYYEALTPGIREETRMLQMFLREVGEMIKVNIFQYYSKSRRIMLLGDAGVSLDDFDYDPDSLVPAMHPTDPDYAEELDFKLPRDRRAQYFHKQFSFYVSPDSVVALHSQDRKMMNLQLSRMGYMDYWTLMETLEVPNVGSPPPIPLPIRDWEQHIEVDPITHIPKNPPLEMRVPETITERLQAQQQVGIGETQNAAGRKASGQEPPSMAAGPGGTPVVRESPK